MRRDENDLHCRYINYYYNIVAVLYDYCHLFIYLIIMRPGVHLVKGRI